MNDCEQSEFEVETVTAYLEELIKDLEKDFENDLEKENA